MIKCLFLIKDTKAEFFHGPFVSANIDTFRRDLVALRGSDTPFSTYPDDFAVYTCGSFNDCTGSLASTAPEHQFNLDQILRAE